MKPIFLLLALALLATACRKKKPELQTAQPVTKEISFGVFAVRTYSNTPSPYGYKNASVKLALEKISKTEGGVQVLWDTTFVDRPLSEYPLQAQKHLVEKTALVNEQQEQLHMRYEIVYISSFDAPQRFGNSLLLANGQNSATLNVEL